MATLFAVIRYGYAIIAALFYTRVNKMANQPVFRITFFNQGQVYEIYARQVYQSDLWGFLEVEEFVFGERTQVIVDPAEEKLKNEFSGVKRSYIPVQAVVRIDEVDKEGACKITEASGGNVSAFPFPVTGGVNKKD